MPESERCVTNRRSNCRNCGTAFINEHIEVRHLEAVIEDLRTENEKLKQQLSELSQNPTARDYAERETAFVSYMG